MIPVWHRSVYQFPEIYEIAFSYRNVKAECGFLLSVYEAIAGRVPSSVIELVCGPGQHIRRFAGGGLVVLALDLEPSMIEYVRIRLEGDAELIAGDMVDYRLSQPVDLAATLNDSLSYLTTNADLVAHFQSVSRSLTADGIYIIRKNVRRIGGGDTLWRAVTYMGGVSRHDYV